MSLQVEELEKELSEANKRLARIDEADKRLVGTLASKPEESAKPVSGPATQANAKPQTAPKAETGPAKQ